MVDNIEINTSINSVNSTFSTNQNASVLNVGEDKSVFERAIIEAFKQKNSKHIYEKLAIALDEIKFIVNDIKSSTEVKKYLLNKNIIDKLSRIIERKFFNVNILIAKILENILDPSNFEILSPDLDLLVTLANEVLNLLELIKSTIVSRQLEKKCCSFLTYLTNLSGVTDEQKSIFNELINGFPTRNSSNVYKNFEDTKEKILKNCRTQTVEEKLEGLNSLMDSFGNTASLDEQFDLLMEKVPAIVKAVIHQPNPEYKEAYFQLGNFICSMLFATKFKVDAFLPEYKINQKDINKNFFFFFAGDELVDEYTKDQTSFLHNTVYELTTQKEILVRCENIFQICNLIVNTLSIYDSIFDLQFVCYIILKRIYFTFPQFRKQIEDNLAVTLVNLCAFKETFERENSEECRMFIHFLLDRGEEDLKHKIKKRVEARQVNIEMKQEYSSEELEDVEYEQLKLSDFNLRIGYPSSYEIEAGSEMSKYIEVHHPNSLVYLGFATQSNDITLHLLKYIPNDENAEVKVNEDKDNSDEDDAETVEEVSEEYSDKGHFKVLLKLERIDSSLNPLKIVFFVPEPGTYKIIFDNTFSWFTSKTMRHRLSVLKPVSEIDFERKVDFRKMGKEFRGVLQSNPSQSQSQSNDEKDLPHANKILMVKHEGLNKAYNLGKIHRDEKLIQENNQYMTIPVLLTKNSIRVVRAITDEHGIETNDYFEIPIESKVESESEKSYSQIFEEEMDKYISQINLSDQKKLFLSTFILEKKLSLPQSEEVIPVTNDQFYKSVFGKLGFYPENLLQKWNNVKLFTNNLADSCMLYLLYQKIIQEEKFNNIIHIHFDKNKAQTSLYFEGVIHDKIQGFSYDEAKSLMENSENVIEFINKVSVIFGGFDLSISSTDIDEKLFDLFAEDLGKKLLTLDIKVSLEKKNREFTSNVLNSIHLFQMTD